MIESVSNPMVRMLRALHSRDGRREQGAFLIEGLRLVAEAVEASWPMPMVLFDPDRAEVDADLAALVGRIAGARPASPRVIVHASDTTTPQGIVAAAAMPKQTPPVAPEEPVVLVVDGVGDPGNAGTLLRSALGAGVRTVLASRGSVDLFAPKVVRGGMGAHFRLGLGVDQDWTHIMNALGSDRVVVIADAQAQTPYYRFDWHQPAALIVGGEAHGPGPEAMRLATATVSIPLAARVESLNAAVAGSVILFEAKRQRETAG